MSLKRIDKANKLINKRKMRKILILINFIILFGCKKSGDGTVEVIPLAPTELKATIISKDQVDLTWKDNSTNEIGYKIERKTDSGVFTEIGSTVTDITTFSDKTVSLNTNYTYRVYSFNKVGKSIQYSNEVSIKTFNVPTIITTSLSNITSNGFKSGGNISNDGGSTIISRGVVWDTSSNPTIALTTKTGDGAGIGAFQSIVSGLSLGTKYYVRSFATNNAGTAYGNEITFTTINTPTLTTNAIADITSSGAKTGGNISSDGGAAITSRGIVWSTSNNPNVTLITKTSNGSGQGTFQSEITRLNSSSKYFVRAYATNSAGTAYGNEISFTTAEGFVFGTVLGANGRIWMDRNLGATRIATSSTDAESYGDLYQWGRGTDGHQLRTSKTTNNLSDKDSPGHGLFITPQSNPNLFHWRNPQNDNLWQGVNGVNNPCPTGYRLPTATEWDIETKSWSSNNSDGAFSSILKLPLAGIRQNLGPLDRVGIQGFYWSSTASTRLNGLTTIPVAGSIYFSNLGSHINTQLLALGFSCRCIKNL
jgi:hypothetical protein